MAENSSELTKESEPEIDDGCFSLSRITQLMQISVDGVFRIDVHLVDELNPRTAMIADEDQLFVTVETRETLCKAVQHLTRSTRGEESKIVLSDLHLVSCTGIRTDKDTRDAVTWKADESIDDFISRNSSFDCFHMDFESR